MNRARNVHEFILSDPVRAPRRRCAARSARSSEPQAINSLTWWRSRPRRWSTSTSSVGGLRSRAHAHARRVMTSSSHAAGRSPTTFPRLQEPSQRARTASPASERTGTRRARGREPARVEGAPQPEAPDHIEVLTELAQPVAMRQAEANGLVVIGKQIELHVPLGTDLHAVNVQHPIDVNEQNRTSATHRDSLPASVRGSPPPHTETPSGPNDRF